MPPEAGIRAAPEIEADEIVGIDLEGLVEVAQPLVPAR
jgi:hypothetical protein